MHSADNNDNSKGSRSFLKKYKVFIVLFTIALGIFLAGEMADFFLSRIIKKKIITSIHESSGGLYSLKMNNFDFEFWSGAVHFRDAKLNQDTVILNRLKKEDPSSNLSNVDIDVEEIKITSISWKNYLMNRNLRVGEIFVKNPEFYFNAKLPKDTIKVGQKSFLDVIPSIVASFAGSLEIEGIRLENGTLVYNVQADTGTSHQKAHEIFLTMKDIRIDTLPVRKSLHSNYVDFSFGHYELITSDNAYKLNVGALKGSYVDSTLIIDSIRLTPNKRNTSSNDHYNVYIERITNRKIDFSMFFKDRKVALGDMLVDHVDFDFSYHTKPASSNKETNMGTTRKFLKEILPYIAYSFTMNRFSIQNAKFKSKVFNTDGGSVMQTAQDVSLSVDSIRIDTNTIATDKYWRNLKLGLNHYETAFSPENVLLKAKHIGIKSISESVAIKGVQLMKLNPADKREQVFYNNYTDEIKLSGISYQGLFNGKGIGIRSVLVNGTKLEIINDSKYANNNPGKMPNEMVRGIPFPIEIDHIAFTNASIKYKTYTEGVKDPGILTFERTKMDVTNFTNNRKKMSAKHPCKIKSEAYVMGKGLFKVEAEVPLLSKDFNCKYQGSLGRIDATNFNSLLEAGGMRLESGQVEAQHFEVTVVKGKATGEMLLMYYDLKTKLVNKKTGKVKSFLSHIANFILKNQNALKNHKGPETAVIDYSRKTEDGFLSYIWGSISEGIVKSVVKDFFEPVVKSK